MATPRKFSIENERKKLEGFYRSLREVVAATLKKMSSEDAQAISASMLDSLCKTLRSMNTLLDDLEQAAEDRERRRRASALAEEARRESPFPRQGSPAADPEADTELHDPAFDGPPPVELPFPKLKA